MAITMTRSVEVTSTERPVHVLIIGGAYAGMAAAMILADLCAGKAPRFFGVDNPRLGHRVPVEITIVDERDGYCGYNLSLTPAESC